MRNRVAVALSFFVSLSACRVVEPPPPPDAPRITAFTASKTRIAAGEQVTLTFTTSGATKVELTDDAGNAIQLEGEVASGTALVAPARSTFYVLRATGAGGRDTAFVQLAVDEPLKEVFLLAVPAAIDSGQQAQLLWGAAGASSVTLTAGGGAPQALTGTTGSVTVTPATTEQYELTAQGAPGTPPLTALAQVEVRPVLMTASLETPNGVQPGETLTFRWTTAGASRVTITEQTFGALASITDPASIASGSFDFVLPATLPIGVNVSDGMPLHFVVSARAGDVIVSRSLDAVVGGLPVITRLDAPEFVSANTTFSVAWKTLSATQITISAGGLPLFQTLPGTQTRVDQGSVVLPAPTAQTEYTLIASNQNGAEVRRSFNVRPVAPPVITTYTLTPSLNAVGDPATARWTTTNAVRVQLRFENGANLGLVTTPSQVANGTLVLNPATSARIALEAFNAAGDSVTEVRTVTLNSSAVSVTPTPIIQGGTASLNWTLAPAGVVETVGLATPAAAPVANSAAFIDLTTVTTAQELVMPDTTNGSAVIPPLQGFRFPLLGTVRPSLYVSINGFIAFAAPAALSTNLDLTATSGTQAPTMLAPLWDDLTMGPSSKVLYALQRSTNGERFLVVQWEKLQLAADSASELTFQAHLYETGQVAFVYKTLTGSLSGVTVGVKDAAFPLVQQFSFDGAPTVPIVDNELNYFSGGPADGTLPFTANVTRRLEFFGRTGTGLLPVSAQVRAFGPGDVAITEVMVFPEASVATTGQWIELHNTADASVDFAGLTVRSSGSSDGGYVIAGGTPVAPYGYMVIGQSTLPADNGGAPVVEVATDLPLGVPDNVKVTLQGTTIGSLSWDAGVTTAAGTSLQLVEDVLTASGQAVLCTRASTSFGPNGAIGTPGARNEPCSPYAISSIPGGFLTAPAGSQILTGLSNDDDYGDGTLPAPFTYFGTPYTAFSLSTNGFMTLGAPLTGAYNSNATTASTSSPNGVLGVFWDDLVRDLGKNAMWRLADRTVISWEHFRIFNTSSTTQIDAQVHLLDNGTIEFHYGDIWTTSTTQATIDRVGGSSATVWIERPDGVMAVPHRINALNGVAPNSGVRFTPVP